MVCLVVMTLQLLHFQSSLRIATGGSPCIILIFIFTNVLLLLESIKAHFLLNNFLTDVRQKAGLCDWLALL